MQDGQFENDLACIKVFMNQVDVLRLGDETAHSLTVIPYRLNKNPGRHNSLAGALLFNF